MKEDKKRIGFVTENMNKFLEAKHIMQTYSIDLRWIPVSVKEVQSDSLEEIILHKVIMLVDVVDCPFIVEDTGLFIDALNGFPGPYASYVYNKLGLEYILKLLSDVHNRSATFVSVGALVLNRRIVKLFKSTLRGQISKEKMGQYGFGYDPIFIPEGTYKTLAQMSLEEKNKTSHRGKLFRKIASFYIRFINLK
ncbi:MAG: RdgB/HAM1 family non-canonical purine NTP pyrophosphatase [Candidatus Geothermarchaeota archaeon]